MQHRICPQCKQEYTQPPAISRTDGKTEICPNCGTLEAMATAGFSPDLQAAIMEAIDTENAHSAK